MKILALNSSPRTGGQSKTELMLTHLVAGMQEAGAEIEVVNLREKHGSAAGLHRKLYGDLS